MKILLMPEMVLLEQNVRRKGDEKFEGGIYIGTEETGEVPEFATVIDVHEDCPEYIQKLKGLQITIPFGKVMRTVDPALVVGAIKKEGSRALFTTHYKNIYVAYIDE